MTGRIGNALLLALRELRRNALRSLLTMLGIIIGVAAVIVLVTLGGGATKRVTDQIASLGSNLLMVSPGKRMGPGQHPGAAPFQRADAEAIAREVPGLAGVAPLATSSSTAIRGRENWATTVTASTESYFPMNNRRITQGRAFTAGEARSGAAVCVIGDTVRGKLFGRHDPVGSRIRLRKLSCQIVDVLEAKGQSAMGMDQDDLVVVPLRTYQRRIAGNEDVGLIQVSVREADRTERAMGDVRAALRARRHIAAGEEDDFHVTDTKEIVSMLSGTTRTLTRLLGAVAAVSLLVGGIGIMNIMLVSVTERTREIGTRLAIGALEREVFLQFLVEAVVLSSCGGLAGIALALAVSAWLAGMLQVPLVFQAPVVLAAFGFSAAVGVAFGYAPARQAARLDPIEALRHE